MTVFTNAQKHDIYLFRQQLFIISGGEFLVRIISFHAKYLAPGGNASVEERPHRHAIVAFNMICCNTAFVAEIEPDAGQ